MRTLIYRPEVDGLRALAVMAVVLFHTHLKMPGGYVGVDIFFVISGYLITALIAGELTAGTFSLRNFWERRIRRIVPAAMVTVAACLVVGFFLMLPSDFADLGRSAVAQALVAANFHFYSEAGYFSAPADAKPLLHFWSLAVEEQFYLVFPFLLLGLHRWRKATIFRGVALIAVMSFGLSVAGVRWFPDATFYLLPTRAWELATGALLALRGATLPLPERSRVPLGWAGIALMVAPMFLYDRETPFPGLAALPPCIGAMLVIWSTGSGDSVLKKLLSLQPVVFIGLISYSLYLWHWPVKVFTHYWFTGIYSPLIMRLLVVVVSFGLAWVSWRYVELPFRNKHRRVALRPLLVGAVGASALTLVLGAFIDARKGLPERFPPAVAQYDAAYADRPEKKEADLTTESAEQGKLPVLADPPTPAPSILLWGDSHARVV
ncbi:MAG TPA: acyltransferase, partial [Opitutus sp.]|nr:acyltransferase [Opitutus sp.]